jgi:hypothetical protein
VNYGMPGCSAHVSPDPAYFLAGQDGVAVYRLPIPDAPGLVGLHFHNQAIVGCCGTAGATGDERAKRRARRIGRILARRSSVVPA